MCAVILLLLLLIRVPLLRTCLVDYRFCPLREAILSCCFAIRTFLALLCPMELAL